MIPQGTSGAAAALPFSLVVTATGAGTPGHAWNDIGSGITDEFKVQLPSGTPGTYTNATISRIVEIGGGNYEYQLTALESADPGKVYYYPNVALHDGNELTAQWEDITAFATVTDLSAVYIALMAEIAAAPTLLLEDNVVVGSHTLGDLTRLFTAVLAGPVLDFTTGTLVYKCPVTNTTRLTVTKDATGRLVCTIGTLT